VEELSWRFTAETRVTSRMTDQISALEATVSLPFLHSLPFQSALSLCTHFRFHSALIPHSLCSHSTLILHTFCPHSAHCVHILHSILQSILHTFCTHCIRILHPSHCITKSDQGKKVEMQKSYALTKAAF